MFRLLQESMDPNLGQAAPTLTLAAQQGNIEALYAALASDPFILDTIDGYPFIDSPLHTAASAGHTHFALEIMILKPSLGRKLNLNGFSALHLALKKGHEKLVRGFLTMNGELVRVKGKEGKTPLHCAAAAGDSTALLRKMIYVCPDSVKELTVRRETALHLSVKNNQYEAFKVLIDCIKLLKKDEILSWVDEDGNTVLHLAIIQRQFKMIELLFRTWKSHEWVIGVNVQDGEGRTALDILQDTPAPAEQAERVIKAKLKRILRHGGAKSAQIIHRRQDTYLARLLNSFHSSRDEVRKNRDALLVVTVFVMTATLQVGVNPPGGFWQDDGKTNGKEHSAGTPILATTDPIAYGAISSLTTAGFVISTLIILQVTGQMPIKWLTVSLFLVYVSYFLSLATSSPGTTASAVVTTLLVTFFFELSRKLQISYEDYRNQTNDQRSFRQGYVLA
ncbi:hypothetical protein IFM89_011242 [Coptis chinensis]|uniref:PGG domain-containing protein n=1 Tax=Coptis chinensis TaxID=261450 RepID=A0A835HJL0_9MAGN|nr:hypothetical protein IFM89_011242 [Coptis chinensis]